MTFQQVQILDLTRCCPSIRVQTSPFLTQRHTFPIMKSERFSWNWHYGKTDGSLFERKVTMLHLSPTESMFDSILKETSKIVLCSVSVGHPTCPTPASSPASPCSRPPFRQGSRDSASMLSGEGHPVSHGLDAPQLHTRVSVGQLRSALLQQTGSGAQPEKV